MQKTTATSARERWREAVADWRASGETSKAYASRHGLNPGTLLYWSSRLNSGGKVASSQKPVEVASPAGVAFEPVGVAGHGVGNRPGTPRMELETRGGHVLRWEGLVDIEFLKRLVRGMESC